MAPRAPFIGNLREAAATVSLAMQKIALLDAGNHGSTRAGDQRRGALKKATDCNQRSRWVEAKENACSDVIRIVVDACLCERVGVWRGGGERCQFESEEEYERALQNLKLSYRWMTKTMVSEVESHILMK